jgi:hypothetical protein
MPDSVSTSLDTSSINVTNLNTGSINVAPLTSNPPGYFPDGGMSTPYISYDPSQNPIANIGVSQDVTNGG